MKFKTILRRLSKDELRYLKREIEGILRSIKPSSSDSILDADFSVRTYNVLKLHDIETIQQLSELSYSEILKWNRTGRKSINEMMNKLSEYKLSLSSNK